MRIIEKKVYQYGELSEKAKQKARQWYLDGMDNDWLFESVLEDANNCAELMGINIKKRDGKPCIYFSGFGSQGDGACFEAEYSHKAGSWASLVKYAPKDVELQGIAFDLLKVQKSGGYALSAMTKHTDSHYCHENTMTVYVYDGHGNNADGKNEEAITEALKSFARWIYKQLEDEYEYHTSKEAIEEVMDANGWEFDEHGEREG